MAVLPSSVDLFALATVAQRPDEAGGPPPTNFYELRDNLLTSVGEASSPAQMRLMVMARGRALAGTTIVVYQDGRPVDSVRGR
jgi:hypothetical protein